MPPVKGPTTGNAFTVPVAATFIVVAPVDSQVIFPDGVPDAEALKRTKTVLVVTVPDDGVKETLPAKPVAVVADTSKPAGAVTIRAAERPVPATVNVCSAEGVPAQVVNAVKVGVDTVMVWANKPFPKSSAPINKKIKATLFFSKNLPDRLGWAKE